MKTRALLSFILMSFFAFLAFPSEPVDFLSGDEYMLVDDAADVEEVYNYNEAWVDSVPYLLEHSRRHEPWALEALAECYRHGKGGLEKSMFNAIMAYELADKNVTAIAEESYRANPTDEFGFINHIMDEWSRDRLSEEQVIAEIEQFPDKKTPWIAFLKEILLQRPEKRDAFIRSKLTSFRSTDEFLIGFTMMSMVDRELFKKTVLNDSEENIRRGLREKLPLINNEIASMLWMEGIKNPEKADSCRAQALESMYLADQSGYLSSANMVRLLTYIEEHGKGSDIRFTDEDLARFDILCSKSYRDHVNSQAIVEEVVEMEPNPVELIEE